MVEKVAFQMRLMRGIREVPVLYRYMRDPLWADGYQKSGDIWISTLGGCRKAENEASRDEGEGNVLRRFSMTSDDPDWRSLVTQDGHIVIEGNVDGVVFENCGSIISDLEAFVVCLTGEHHDRDYMNERFGQYCVRIDQPMAFFEELSRALVWSHRLVRGTYWQIRYIGRDLHDHEGLGIPVPCLKPQSFSREREVRMYWEMGELPAGGLQPFLLKWPPLARFCKRVA
jgi:hypothetical protein